MDQDTFERSKANQTRYPQPNKKKRDYPLKGKIFCGCCDHALSRTFQKTSYYFCRHSDADKSKPCYKMRYEVTALEEAVFQSLKTQMEVLGAESIEGPALVKAAVSQRPEYERQIEELEDGKLHLYATGLTTALADLLIDRVRLYPGGRIEIEYKVQDLFQ